ncbi:MAG: 3-deoxy-manno-octulosonate cytidylyltransferase [Candidatus Loosdrechtia sp.]|uniref:3-deoxy-manno-octulosonate cytidylyltransferase n=1 Tax=Candidatus Loosdrechtia sp. TaxID=3101272 RepID=UPI003A6AE787|nr:MAG: 3-deoxy-manno-octulosonate cytidylyltransferase [Candidatus Jettenia sp. AMX2]
MKVVVIIPARYASTRLPGKLILPEAKTVTGRYIIEHVYQNVRHAKRIDGVIVATDSREIYDIVKAFGGDVEMTSLAHTSGTDRIAEVAVRTDADIIINVQGDEPEIKAAMADKVLETLVKDERAVMSTLANKITSAAELSDPNVVKVVLDKDGYAMYFSRSQIPYVRDSQDPVSESGITFLRHLGIYAYRREFLLAYPGLPASPMEHAEKLEQLRALFHGYKIKVAFTEDTSRGIDTKEDFIAFMERYNHD